jgi:hypothetical protein
MCSLAPGTRCVPSSGAPRVGDDIVRNVPRAEDAVSSISSTPRSRAGFLVPVVRRIHSRDEWRRVPDTRRQAGAEDRGGDGPLTLSELSVMSWRRCLFDPSVRDRHLPSKPASCSPGNHRLRRRHCRYDVRNLWSGWRSPHPRVILSGFWCYDRLRHRRIQLTPFPLRR